IILLLRFLEIILQKTQSLKLSLHSNNYFINIYNFDNLMKIAKNEIIKFFLAEEYIQCPLYHVDALILNNEVKYLIIPKILFII
ncbi:MAG: hypothetical protein N4Q26_00185, partial [Lactobacillus iners]|nr:hypothetical protein [Lactobacillus iners]